MIAHSCVMAPFELPQPSHTLLQGPDRFSNSARPAGSLRPPPCSRHPGADEINQEIDREPVREHDRLAASGECGEQFKRAALGLRAAPTAE
jgi:hypothetical protein